MNGLASFTPGIAYFRSQMNSPGRPWQLSSRLLIAASAGALMLAALAGLSAPQTASQDLLAQADAVLRQMSEITGLPTKAPLQKQIISRSEVRTLLTENLHREITPRELHVQEAVLQAFGLVSRNFNLEEFLVNFYTEQAAGFYDPPRRTMFIADWVAPEMQRLVLAHELTHALQDQNFNLEKFLRARREDDDATNARQAVVEGHATAAMMQQMVEPVALAELPALEPVMAQVIHQQFEEFPAFSKAPFFFRLEALFPYVEGMGFMQRGLQQGGWKKLNSLFDDPPRATKEIFEPQVYFEKQPLPTVSLSRPTMLKMPGLEFLAENTLGELGYYALLGQLISEEEAKTVGKGWLADRYILYEESSAGAGLGPAHAPSKYTLVARTRWSTAETALAFFHDYHTILAHKYPELAPDKRSATDLFVGSTSSGQVMVLRKGDECRWAEGVPAAQAEAMLSWLRSM